ncbi:MAG: hypothetical protein U5K55_01365 [Aliarcobacter sp.]|nr:hypothetical protein [Aliarcobacter sp.]
MKLNNCIDGNWLFLNYGKDGIHIPHATAIYNRKKAMELNFYSQNIISTDWESILKLLINNKIGFIDTASCSWRQIDNSQSKTTDINLIFDV